jgi:uncharacterized CHY-type Zn-finger protein
MFSKKELMLAYGVAVCLLVIGAISYAAFPLKAPQEPLRLMFKVAAGNVLFNHKIHGVEEGYGLSCGDCHHTLSEDEYADAQSCSECHELDEGDEEMPKRADAFHLQCINCHKDYEAGPIECTGCHAL